MTVLLPQTGIPPNPMQVAMTALMAAVQTPSQIAQLEPRLQQVLFTSVAFWRGWHNRGRQMPTEAVVGNEVSAVLGAFATDPAAADAVASALGAIDQQWGIQLNLPVLWPGIDVPPPPPPLPPHE